jgi:hypothetical protein
MSALRREGKARTTLGLNGGWIFLASSLLMASATTNEGKEKRRDGKDRKIREVGHALIPVNILGKERMSLDLLSPIHAQASCRVPLQQACHHASGLGRHVWGEVERVGENTLIHCVHVLVVERWESSLNWREIEC